MISSQDGPCRAGRDKHTGTQEISVDSDVCVGDPEKADRVVRDIVNYRLDKRSRQVLHEDGFVHVQPTSLTTNWAHSSPTVCATVAVCYSRTMSVPLTAMSMAALILAPPDFGSSQPIAAGVGPRGRSDNMPASAPATSVSPCPGFKRAYKIRINTEWRDCFRWNDDRPGTNPRRSGWRPLRCPRRWMCR